MAAARNLLDAPELHAGLVAGCVALVATALLARARATLSGRDGPPAGVLGATIVLATVGALAVSARLDGVGPVPVRVAASLAVLWVAGEVGARRSVPVGALLAVVGGLGLVDPSDPPAGWITVVLTIGTALGGMAVADLDRRAARTGLAPQLLAVSIIGLYACVPDTELVLALLGATLPLLLLTWPRVLARLGAGGAYAAIGLYLWIATVEGVGRSGSIVGAIAALGLLVGEPLGRLVASRGARGLRPGVLLVGQLLLATYAARIVGRVDDPVVAAALAVPVLVAGTVVGIRTRTTPTR